MSSRCMSRNGSAQCPKRSVARTLRLKRIACLLAWAIAGDEGPNASPSNLCTSRISRYLASAIGAQSLAMRMDNALAPAPSAGIMRPILEKKRAIALWPLSAELEQTFSQQADTSLVPLSISSLFAIYSFMF